MTAGDARALTRQLVADIVPVDAIETAHRGAVLGWIDSGTAIWRTARPATPPMHLVSYSVVVDPGADNVLLVDHRLAGRWLPSGGHTEPGEHPAVTARRELVEELGVEAVPHPAVGGSPLLVTITTTVDLGGGTDSSHDDVSLWFVFAASTATELRPDGRELTATRWWPTAEVRHGPGTRFDPHLPRFLAKLTGRTARQRA